MRQPPPPPPRPSEPDQAPVREAAEVRIAMLRAEVEAATDRTRQALLHYEIGHLCEHEIGNDAMAVKEYLTAYNLDASFRPPLFDLVRIFERRMSFKNLARLYDAEDRASSTAADAASALVDRGVLLEDREDQRAEARGLYEAALERDGSHRVAALMLERAVRADGDADALQQVMTTRAQQARDPVLKGALLGEVAAGLEAQGDVDGAMEALREAATGMAGRWRFLAQLERVARRNERVTDLIEAVEGRAALAEATARGEDEGQGSGTFSVQRFREAEAASRRAAALWSESARLRLVHLGDAEGAVVALDHALSLHPDDVLLRQEHMLAAELAGELDKAGDDARTLIDIGVTGPFAAAQHFRLAELAMSKGDPEGARASLTAALQADPGSPAALAVLDDLLLDAGMHEERLERLEARAERTEGTARAHALWRAAQIAVEQLGEFDRARELYREAAEADDDPVPIWRELFGAARRRKDDEALWESALALLDGSIDPEERSALLHDLLTMNEDGPSGRSSRRALLTRALEDATAVRWAADAARLYAAWNKDDALLARAHLTLAERATGDDAAAAHLCAAARALTRSGDEAQATDVLRRALERVPGHRYAVALLEELLRASGKAEEVVELLREAASAEHGADMNLLLAGAAAEAAGDTKLAAQSYEDAADHDPTAVAPLHALRRLAERTGDRDLLGRALEGLSEREIAAGEPGRSTLELGEHYLLVAGKPELAEGPMRSALEGTDAALDAALGLLLLPVGSLEPEVRIDAAARLLELAPEADRPMLLRELAHAALLADGGAEQASQAAEQMHEAEPEHRGPLWTRLHAVGTGTDPERAAQRADLWLSLADSTSDRAAALELVLHGLRAKVVAVGDEAADDAFLYAHALEDEHPDSAAAAVALDETLGGGDDPESRAQALAARLVHAGREGRATLEAARGRALLAAGRAAEAFPLLREALASDDADLASWEALRVAARETEQWQDVARACDRLAEAASGSFQAQLLEESAAACMDQLGDDAAAEQRLQRALEVDLSRPIAYGRLHDLLAEREDTSALLDLVTRRIDAVDDATELEKLYYEQARLRRSEGDREGALASLENLLTLDEAHVGGLALGVEVHVSLEQFSEAVDMLRKLATADVPDKQKRLARLGAADFLDKKLHDREGAMAELLEVERIGLADAALYARMADVAERSGRLEEAVRGLDEAVLREKNAIERARLARHAGDLRAERIGDLIGARTSYRTALQAVPTDVASGEALVSLLDMREDREVIADNFEDAVRAQVLDHDPTDEAGLRKLARAAAWRGDRDLQMAALTTLVALGVATEEELQANEERTEVTERSMPRGTLTAQAFPHLRAPGDASPFSDLARLAFEGLAQMDGIDPAIHGVSRSHQVNPKEAHPVRDEVFRLAQVFGLPPGDFYIGGSPELVAVMPGRKERPTWVIGPKIEVPLAPGDRFEIGRRAMAYAEGTLPLVGRPPGQASHMLLSAVTAAGVQLRAAQRRPGVQELAPDLARVQSRRARRAIADLAPQLPDDVRAFEAYCHAARRTSLRAGLLMCGDLVTVLRAVLGQEPDLEAVRASEDARDLVRFWISIDALALRRALGIAS